MKIIWEVKNHLNGWRHNGEFKLDDNKTIVEVDDLVWKEFLKYVEYQWQWVKDDGDN